MVLMAHDMSVPQVTMLAFCRWPMRLRRLFFDGDIFVTNSELLPSPATHIAVGMIARYDWMDGGFVAFGVRIPGTISIRIFGFLVLQA